MVKERTKTTREQYRVFRVTQRNLEEPFYMVLILVVRTQDDINLRKAIVCEIVGNEVVLENPFYFPAETVINPNPSTDEYTGITFPGLSGQGDFKDFSVKRGEETNTIFSMRLMKASKRMLYTDCGSEKPILPLNSVNNFSQHPPGGNSIGKAG